MEQTLADLRHSIRGALNALKLCLAALELPMDTPARLEFLSHVETSADRLAELLLELENCPEQAETAPDASEVEQQVR